MIQQSSLPQHQAEAPMEPKKAFTPPKLERSQVLPIITAGSINL